jgi:DNA invertase Pin-like site-specific DNA recombinase
LSNGIGYLALGVREAEVKPIDSSLFEQQFSPSRLLERARRQPELDEHPAVPEMHSDRRTRAGRAADRNPMLYGYARVSTIDQDLALQRTALKAAGCEVIRAEKASGTRRNGRTELQTLLEFLREGDTLVVTRIDRLARSVKDLQDIVHELKVSKVTLKATEQPIDTGTAAGKAFLDMLGVFAEFETNLRKERQLEGITAAKARGVYKGRKPSIDAAAVRRLAAAGMGGTEVARQLGIARASVYRLLQN